MAGLDRAILVLRAAGEKARRFCEYD